MIPNVENKESCSQILPFGWEQAWDVSRNRYFYVDHNTKTTTWLNPLEKPKDFSECFGDQLPYGWEQVDDPIIGVYYTNHIQRRNQWTNPVTEWRKRLDQHHYDNGSHFLPNGRTSNGMNESAQNKSSTSNSKPCTPLPTSDIGKSTTSLYNSTTLDTEIIGSTQSNNSTRGSKHDASLLDIMDIRFGRDSSQSFEV